MTDEAEGKNLELIIKALSAALHDANIGMPEIVFRNSNDLMSLRTIGMPSSTLTRTGDIKIDGIQITDGGHDARAIAQAHREGYAAGTRAAAEAGSMSKLELLDCALAMEAGEPGRWASYIETAKAQVIQSYKLRRPL